MNTTDILLALVRAEITQRDIADGTREVLEQYTPELYMQLYRLAQKHDIAQIVAKALTRLNLLRDDELIQEFRKSWLLAVYRWEKLNNAFTEITQVLERERIPYVPLKGSIIRGFYPEPWMRTSCDIDILVHREHIDQAVSALKSQVNYKADEKMNYHDISLYSPSGIHLELHFSIQENMENADGLLSQVWDYVLPVADNSYRYEQTPEFFLFHHIAHIAYHLLHGGCGIKPFLDHQLFDKNQTYDEALVREYCRQCGLETLYDQVVCVKNVWFGTEQHTELSANLAQYIISGGVYGSFENKLAIEQNKQGGKVKYALSRIFASYDYLSPYYPELKKHKWLMPVVQVRRWVKILFGAGLNRGVKELNVNNAINKSQAQDIDDMLNGLGL